MGEVESIESANSRKPLSKEEKKDVKQHLKKVKRQLYRNLVDAYRGLWCWRIIVRKYKKSGVRNWAIILLPDTNDRDNYLSLLYLDCMLDKEHYDKALVLTHSEIVKKIACFFSDKIAWIEEFSRKDAESLMQLYCLYNFDKRFYCASLDEPYGRSGSKLIGACGISAEEIFAIGIYKLHPFERVSAPQYYGDDEEIISFLKRAAQDAREGYSEKQ